MEDYAQAALRHWQDAQLLEEHRRIGNADQLYGLAAECAIKKVLVQLPLFAPDGSLQKEFKYHINLLWDKAGHQSIAKAAPRLPSLLQSNNPFSDWKIDQRYEAEGAIRAKQLQSHREWAKRLLGAVGLSGVRQP